MRFFSFWNLKVQQKPLFSRYTPQKRANRAGIEAILSACHNACRFKSQLLAPKLLAEPETLKLELCDL